MPGPVDPRLLRRAGATRWYLIAGALIGTATAVLIVAQAWLLAHAIGGVFAQHRLEPVTAALPALVAVIAGRATLSWLHTVAASRASAAVKAQLRADVLAARLRQPLHATVETGPLVTLLATGLDALDGYFGRYLPQLVLAVTVPAVVGVAILSTDVISAVIIAATLPLVVIFMILIGWLTQARMERRWRVQSRLAHHFADLVGGLVTLQVFGRARAQAAGLARTSGAHRRETLGILRVSFLSALVLELVATLSVALVAVGVGLRVVQGDLTLTVALFVLILAPEAYLPLRQVGTHYHDSVDGLAAAEQAFALIEAGGEAVPAPRGAEHPGPGPIDSRTVDSRTVAPRTVDLSAALVELVDLGVRYPGRTEWAVRHLDVTVSPGEVVALVGPSGAGKSTALTAVLGFTPVTEGKVRVGGTPLPDLDLTPWRRQLAWVGQHPSLISGTIADNVRLGAPSASDSEVVEALSSAGAVGLEPQRRILDQGAELSSGELRRVAVARALLRVRGGGGRLLLLDEPTAGLDAEAELRVIDSIRRLGVGALVVSHRPAVVAAADRVVTLQPTAADDAAEELEASDTPRPLARLGSAA